MIRKPAVAGQFYEANFEKLEKQIKDCFLSKLGPAELPLKKREKNILGAICPHAGYAYSGPCASWAYKEIGESVFADLYILLGPNHTGLGKTSTLLEDFQTPFGVIKVDKEFGVALIKNSSLVESRPAHLHEHSIEVQLPFLQFVERDYLKQLRFLPIVVNSDCNYKELAAAIKKTIEKTKKSVRIIASSDFTHYGSAYGYTPFSSNIKENITALDNKAVEFIKKLDAQGFLEYVKQTGATICGALPIAVLIEILKDKAKKIRVLQHYNSGDVSGDYSNCVDYLSIVFY